MATRWKRHFALGVASTALACVTALASGCELAVKLDLGLAEADGGAAVCAICLDGTIEPDGNIEFGPQDAGIDAPEEAGMVAVNALDGGSSDSSR